MKYNFIKRNLNINSIEDYICKNLNLENISFLDKRANYCISESLITQIDNLLKKHKNSKVFTISDYDVDGITSSCEIEEIYKHYGINNYIIRIPKRSEGYGVSQVIVEEILNDKDITLVVMLDNGIVSVEFVDLMNSKGIDTLIIDHHLRRDDGKIPNATVLLDFHVNNDLSDFKHYCTAGLVAKIAESLKLPQKSMDIIYSFAAIGTVADAVEMSEDNRLLVKKGLSTLTTQQGRTKGLYFLLKSYFALYRINEDTIGYKIGPCINAAGRLYDDGAKDVFNALKYSADGNLEEDVKRLYEINEERKKLVSYLMPIVYSYIEENNLENSTPIIVKCPESPKGIVGILAGNITEKYNRASIVFTKTPDGNWTGSGRSVKNTVHLKDLLDSCSELILKYGGHECAAGITIEDKNFDKFVAKTTKLCISQNLQQKMLNEIFYDLEISAEEIDTFAEQIEKYRPFGEGNPSPTFLVRNFYINKSAILGNSKKTVSLTNEKGFCALNFERNEDLDNFIKSNEGKYCDLIGTVNKNVIGKDTVTYQVLFSYITEAFSQIKSNGVVDRMKKLDDLLDSLNIF